MDGTGDHRVKQDKPDPKKQVSRFLSYMKQKRCEGRNGGGVSMNKVHFIYMCVCVCVCENVIMTCYFVQLICVNSKT
jgi:hypothetical protein